ncbi:MAG: hypothetical protein KME04_09025 [Pleurocapsa minor GSE-CHR-MK-17-07R]|jgi:hypothetical protein|nr:hypothetical protein [Pleurocapsa minor GSE-CHR-MK 17-07R]
MMNTYLLIELNELHMQDLARMVEMEHLAHLATQDQRLVLVEERHISPPADQPTRRMHTTNSDTPMLHLHPHRVFG